MALQRGFSGKINVHRLYPAFRSRDVFNITQSQIQCIEHFGGRLAIVVHAFHLDIVKDIVERLEFFPPNTELVFTTDTEKKKEAITAELSPALRLLTRIIVCENRGRDIAPKLVTLAEVGGDYDLILFLHSKKSVYLSTGGNWRQELIDVLAGSVETVSFILHLFQTRPRLGLVYPQHFLDIEDRLSWGGNRAEAGRLAQRLGIALERCRSFDFPSGSMFWARPAALQPLTSLGLSPSDFPQESGQLDGTLAHAIERLFLYVVERAGFSWIKVSAPSTRKKNHVLGSAITREKKHETFRVLTGAHGLIEKTQDFVNNTQN